MNAYVPQSITYCRKLSAALSLPVPFEVFWQTNIARKQQQLQACKSFRFQRSSFRALDLSNSQIPHYPVHRSAKVEPEKISWHLQSVLFYRPILVGSCQFLLVRQASKSKILRILNIGLGENASLYTIILYLVFQHFSLFVCMHAYFINSSTLVLKYKLDLGLN